MSVGSALGDLVQSLFDVINGILSSIFAIFHSILAVFTTILGSIVQFANSLLSLIMHNFVIIGIAVAAFFIWGYTQSGQRKPVRARS